MTFPTVTSDIDDAFFVRLHEVGDELEARPRDLLSVWFSESGVRASAHNPSGNASGIFQAMPAILVGLGWTAGDAAYRQLTATEQLEWALRYYRPHRGQLGSIGAVYTATFLPALLKHAGAPDYVLCAKYGQLGFAYGPNAVFDANFDLQITVGELEQAVRRNCWGPRWMELLDRLTGSVADSDGTVDAFDLGTTRGLQAALTRLGYDPGPIDGMPGQRTVTALRAFQGARGLRPDGMYGPKSREALTDALLTGV